MGLFVPNPNATLEPSSLEFFSMLRFENRSKLAELGADNENIRFWQEILIVIEKASEGFDPVFIVGAIGEDEGLARNKFEAAGDVSTGEASFNFFWLVDCPAPGMVL